MPVTDAQLKTAILTAIGDTSSGTVGAQIDVQWALFDEMRYIAPRLQYYSVLAEMATMMIGWLSDIAIDVEDMGQKQKLHQRVDTLKIVLQGAQENIVKIEAQAKGRRTPAVGPITTVEPIAPGDDPLTQNLADPAHRRYRGDPLLGMR